MILLGVALFVALGLILSIFLKSWAGRKMDEAQRRRRDARRRRYYARKRNGGL